MQQNGLFFPSKDLAMSPSAPTLHMICGKIAAGKSTLARDLARADTTVLISEDDLLKSLFGEHMSTPKDFVEYSAKLKTALGPHIVGLLNSGVSVVLDFQANTVDARDWMRTLLDQTSANHVLHLLTPPDEICLERLRARNAQGDHAFAATEEQFRMVSKYFVEPAPEEGFTIIRHTEAF